MTLVSMFFLGIFVTAGLVFLIITAASVFAVEAEQLDYINHEVLLDVITEEIVPPAELA